MTNNLSGEDYMNNNKSVVDTETIQVSTTEITEEAKQAIERYLELHIKDLENTRKKNERSE